MPDFKEQVRDLRAQLVWYKALARSLRNRTNELAEEVRLLRRHIVYLRRKAQVDIDPRQCSAQVRAAYSEVGTDAEAE